MYTQCIDRPEINPNSEHKRNNMDKSLKHVPMCPTSLDM